MVRHADDLGEVRAAADLLGHSPDMMLRVYAHALPESISTVTDKIGKRARRGRADMTDTSSSRLTSQLVARTYPIGYVSVRIRISSDTVVL